MTATPAPPVDASPDSGSERIVDVELTDEMQGSFLEYAYSVIYSRALPDARDGLKPVQRRIIYQMSQMGLTPEKGHVKSARVVGDVMGKLHPHGDSAIYDALVRLSQSFSMRVPMIDGHGNFGSLDDGPAAARYTEARLMPAAIAMVENLDEDVVDFIPNYDNQLTQPSVLPAALPHLLINGASGIAVGMATNMAPHNVHEVVAAARHLIEHPEATLEDLMRFVPGPDLPTGGAIVGLEGITDAYATGRGSFKMRASVSVESIGPRKTGLVVTELPYLVGPERVIDKIKDAVNAKKLLGISDVTDLTDRHHGLRLVIAIKSGFDPEAVLGELYRLTPLEESFSINSVALVEGQPQTLGLVDLLRVYVAHRLSVVTRRSQYRLTKRRERLHLVEGLLKAIVDIDEVIALIRSSEDASVAKTRLQEVFSLSGEQTDYILELRLRRLTKISRIELESERDALVAEISHLTELLGSEELLRHTVSDELASAAESFGTPRRTTLLDQVAPTARAPLAVEKLEIADAPCFVALTTSGLISRMSDPSPLSSGSRKPASHEVLLAGVSTRLKARLGALTSDGVLHAFEPMDLPVLESDTPQLARGIAITEYLGLTSREAKVLGLFTLENTPTIVIGTAQGVVKRVALEGLGDKPHQSVMSLKDGDFVVGSSLAPDDASVVLITNQAQLLTFSASLIRPQGLGAGGMTGINLPESATVICATAVLGDTADVITISGSSEVLPGTATLRAKRSALETFPPKGRATSGVRSHSFLRGEDVLTHAYVGAHPQALGAKGQIISLPKEHSKRDGSGSPLSDTVASLGEKLS